MSGPRLPGGKFHSKGKKRGRPKKVKGGLNKTERKQVNSIAKKAVNSMAETKYFETVANIAKSVPNPIWKNGTNLSEVSCLGFMTGDNQFLTTLSGPNAQPVYYGVDITNGSEVQMANLNMNKIFTTNDAIESRRQQAIDGNSIRPSYAEVQWYLERPQIDIGSTPLNAAPIQVRIIRVRPRAVRGSNQPVNPKNDLFLDQYNEPFGVASETTGNVPIFSNYEFQMAKVNTRRYRVISDKMITMSASSVTDDSIAQVTLTHTSGARRLKTKHNIGKELYYTNPNGAEDGDQFPQTGFEPEYILYHFQTLGQSLTESERVTTQNINVTARPVSTFKDV